MDKESLWDNGEMVAVTSSSPPTDSLEALSIQLTEQLPVECAPVVGQTLAFVRAQYADRERSTGEDWWAHVQGVAHLTTLLRLDLETRLAALCMGLPYILPDWPEKLGGLLGEKAIHLIAGVYKLDRLHIDTHLNAETGQKAIQNQVEVLRKMLLGMVEDVRGVILLLASRTQTLRYYTQHPGPARDAFAKECMAVYASLANRLGVWQLKWELEDLSFRFLEPETYKQIAKMLDERRIERESFIAQAIQKLKGALAELGVTAEVYGRPKHIYSIYNKMRSKKLAFNQLFDIRALRVLVEDVRDCYTALGVVHQIWQPIPLEFDDYITKPKGNDYRSLHTAVLAADGRSLEVQIRTHEMHRHAEMGVAAHWRYKEGSGFKGGIYDEKIALLRNLLAWRDEITDASQWVRQFKQAALDDTIYVMTPQGRVVDLPRGATPIDFAYHIHTSLGHRCRGAEVNGQWVALTTPLENGQTVSISTIKEGAPSRDWLDPRTGYVHSHRARQKIRQYFTQLEITETLAKGRAFITREMQREGQSQTNIDNLAVRLGFKDAISLFSSAGRGDLTTRAVQVALRPETPNLDTLKFEKGAPSIPKKKAGWGQNRVVVLGVGKLLTSLSRCCKPAPPDAISGFVTRGRGISVHRLDCRDYLNLVAKVPERIVPVEWEGGEGSSTEKAKFLVDVLVQADDRQGLLRDISDVLAREKFNVVAVNTLSKQGSARMRFTIEVDGILSLQRALNQMKDVKGVFSAVRT